MVKENEIPREEFLFKTKLITNEALEIALEIQKQKDKMLSNQISVSEFKEYVISYKGKLDFLENTFVGFPESDNDELVKIQQASRNAITSVHNVLVVVTNDSYSDSNVSYLVAMNIEDSIKEFNEYYSLLKSINPIILK